ncbi:MAG: Na+/H+ antiporter NhaA [Thermoanaerobaculia bacterium]
MQPTRAAGLDRPVDPARDHVLGPSTAGITLVEYGSYVCSHCHTAHDVIRRLRDRFGDRLRYVYRHLPLADRADATRAAELAEYAEAVNGRFWEAHDLLMRRGPEFEQGELDALGAELGVPPRAVWEPEIERAAEARIRADARSGIDSGARVTPTFFINGRRYEGAWDESSLTEAMFRSLGHRIHAASVDFARWAPSTGLLLLLMTIAALVLSNSRLSGSFLAFWELPFGFRFGGSGFVLPLIDWVNHGLLSVFFVVVGLEIKRELTIGRLATRKAAAFPLAAATGGMVVPAVLFLLIAPAAFRHTWGMSITTDTAFAVALLVLLGDRVPVDLRVFLTAVVIADDLVAIAVVAFFYSAEIHFAWLGVAAALTVALYILNRSRVYKALPYAIVGVALWFALHESGVHATLAGVVLAMAIPTRPPANLRALVAQAHAVMESEAKNGVLKSGPSETALTALDAIHDRIESPAAKFLRSVEPWSSYFVLPLFALANAGLVWSPDVITGRGLLVAAIVTGLVAGKLLGIFAGAWLAVRLGIGAKPASYNWRHVAGTGALAGIGFTMSLFIAGQALTGDDFGAAKIAVFAASLLAGTLGVAILWKRAPETETASAAEESGTAIGAASENG